MSEPLSITLRCKRRHIVIDSRFVPSKMCNELFSEFNEKMNKSLSITKDQIVIDKPKCDWPNAPA